MHASLTGEVDNYYIEIQDDREMMLMVYVYVLSMRKPFFKISLFWQFNLSNDRLNSPSCETQISTINIIFLNVLLN